LHKKMLLAPDDLIWQMRATTRASLVTYVRARLTEQLAASGASPQAIEGAKSVFDPHALTLGFARRFVPYKRPDLLLLDPGRLARLLTDTAQPVQLVIAGKAPPADQAGKDLIRRWIEFIQQWNMEKHVIFLSDYDMLLAAHLVQGVDVWLNTPQRPWEASGTSGMKVLVNGGLNLSELDGWWVEAYTSEVGWALGDGKEHGNDPGWDWHEAESLFQTLEQAVIPAFYTRNAGGLPVAWIEKVRRSMATLTPYFSANRTVREYTDKFYVPAAKAYRERSADDGAAGAKIVHWKHAIDQGWPQLHFGEVKVNTEKDVHTGEDQHGFEVQLYLGAITPDMVRVELFARGIDEGPLFRQQLDLLSPAGANAVMTLYGGKVPGNRPAGDYTARVLPWLPGVVVPLEATQILWQR
jgi:starch phosphorylase